MSAAAALNPNPSPWSPAPLLVAAAWLFVAEGALRAQSLPKLNSVSPEWVERGTTNQLTIEGENLGKVTRLLLSGEAGLTVELAGPSAPAITLETSRGGLAVDAESDRRAQVRLVIAADSTLAARELRFVTPAGVSNPLQLHVGFLREARESESNNATNQAQLVELPIALSGVIGEPNDVDYFRFKARQHERLLFDVHANRLGSPLDSSLVLFDAGGHELKRGEDDHGLDSFIDFTVPAEGEYVLQLRDFRYQGGANFKYRLYAGVLPYVDYLFPLGAQRGQAVELSLRGRNLEEGAKMRLQVAADAPTGPQEIRARTARGFTNSRWFDIGDAPEFIETEPNNTTNQANSVTLPVSVNGRIQAEKDTDVFKFRAEKGQTVVFEVHASRFGSPLDVVLSLSDAAGRVLRRDDDAGSADARFEHTFAESGEHYLAVRDLLEHGGDDYVYRLKIYAPSADFAAKALADTPRVRRGALTPLRVEVERSGGFGGAVEITAEGLPPGVAAAPLVIPPELSGASLMFSARTDAPVGAFPFKLRATGVLGGRKAARLVEPLADDRPVLESFLSVLEAPPFEVELLTLNANVEQSQGMAVEALVHRHNGYAEDIQARLEGYSTGREPITRSLETGPATIKGLESRVVVPFKARLDAELGTRPVWLRIEGKVAGEPVVIASRPLPLTIREFPFSLANSIPRVSLTALRPGTASAAGETEFLVRVARRGWFNEDIALRLEGLPEGVAATIANLPRGAGEATLKLAASDKAPAGKEFKLTVIGVATVSGRTYETRSSDLQLLVNAPAETNAVAEAKPAAKE